VSKLIASYLFCNVLAAGLITAGQDFCQNCGTELARQQGFPDNDATSPEWVVIFDVPPGNQGNQLTDPWVNMRVIVRADRDGQAILKATRYLQGLLDGRAFERMKFVEIAPKK